MSTNRGLARERVMGGLSSPAETFMLDSKQHLLINGSRGLFLFVLN